MRKIHQDIKDIEREIEEVRSRENIEIGTFRKIIKRRGEIWDAYFLDCLEKEKSTLEYINQQMNEDITINFQKLIRRIDSLNQEIEKLREDNKILATPMEFEKLVEWTKGEDVLSDLFIMPVKISDIKKLVSDALHAEEVAK